MSIKQELVFSIDAPKKEFEKHLEIIDNDRIILSAPFGSGKTYFLKDFFKEHPEYDSIHIYPVNYSVASNEDIFELIKYDILFELMGKSVDFEKVDFSELDFLPLFIGSNKVTTLEVLTPLLSFIPTVGKALTDISDNLLSFYKEFDKKMENIQIDDKTSVIQYLESFTDKKGSIYEEDFYTQLIYELVQQLKQKENTDKSKKKTVLIIDDLDRIDPEHIFRILNVLSAQIDKNGGDNKFNFDKIILVFDQENIRNIFENRYGSDVDYIGYIDKFYSYKIFDFFNPEGIKKELQRLLSTINVENGILDLSDSNNKLVESVLYLFNKLIDTNTLTVRRLLKALNSKLEYRLQNIDILGVRHPIHEKQVNILFIARLLLLIFDRWDELFHSLNMLTAEKNIISQDIKWATNELIEESILLLDAIQHQFDEGDHYVYNLRENLNINYSLNIDRNTNKYYVRITNRIDEDLYDLIFTEALVNTMKMIKSENLLLNS